MEQERTICDLLGLCLIKWKTILIGACVVAVLLGGFQGVKQLKALRGRTAGQEAADAAYAAEMEVYEQEKQDLERTLESASAELEAAERYYDESLYLKIDPYDEYESFIYLTINNPDEAVLGKDYGNQENPEAYMIRKISGEYETLWKSADLSSVLGIDALKNVKDKYIREVLFLTVPEEGQLLIDALGTTQEEAEELASSLLDYLLGEKKGIESRSCSHDLAVGNCATVNTVNSYMFSYIRDREADIQLCAQNKANAENALKELAVPRKVNLPGKKAALVSTAKFGIVGFVGGAILMAVILVVIALLKWIVINSREVEKYCSIPLLGSIPGKDRHMEKLAGMVNGERVYKDAETAAAIVAEKCKRMQLCESIVLASTISLEKMMPRVETLKKALEEKNFKVTIVEQAIESKEMMDALENGASVVLIEKAAVTDILRIRDMKNLCAMYDKEVSGFVLSR